jgi:hypothetical protein
MRTAPVLPYDTLGSFCQRHETSREEVFRANPQLHFRRMFTPEGVPTAVLEEGEVLTLVGVGAAFGPRCVVNAGQGGWQKKDGRWYYAHHEGLTLASLASKYGTDVMTIWKGSKNAGTVPTTWQSADKAQVFQGGERTLFWMPDGAIEKAYADGCIPDKGDLGGPKPLVASSGLTVPCGLNTGKGGWQKGADGRWYFGHGTNILLGDLAEVYLGNVGAYQQIFNGSQSRGLLPPGSTPDKVSMTLPNGQQTMFWMPDDGILKAHALGCIPDPGNLEKPPQIPCTDGAKSTWSFGLGQWECPKPCGGGRTRALDGLTCVCPEGTVAQNPSDPQSPCKPKGGGPCPAGSILQPDGSCKDLSTPKNPCPAGMKKNTSGECVKVSCPAGQSPDQLGQCRPNKPEIEEKPSREDDEEKASIWPWVLGGLAILGVGGAILYASSKPDDLSQGDLPQGDLPEDDEPPSDEPLQDDDGFGFSEGERFQELRAAGGEGHLHLGRCVGSTGFRRQSPTT